MAKRARKSVMGGARRARQSVASQFMVSEPEWKRKQREAAERAAGG